MAWFVWFPDRYEQELQGFRDNNIEFVIDQAAFEQGQLRLTLRLEESNRPLMLEAIYPDLFPFFPPQVFAHEISLRRHQSPSSKHVCLIGRNSLQWHTTFTLGWLLRDRLPTILRFDDSGNPADIIQEETPQGEPISEYFNSEARPDTYALYRSSWVIPPEISQGYLTLVSGAPDSDGSYSGFVMDRVEDENGNLLAEWGCPVPFEKSKRHVKVPWKRIHPPPSGSSTEFLQTIKDNKHPHLLRQAGVKKDRPQGLFAIVYTEEIRQFEDGDGWMLFEFRFDRTRAKQNSVSANSVRTFRAGPEDLAARMPSVRSLSKKRILVVGLGALGSTVALEIARSGAEAIELLDFDYVEPSTVRRWALGWPFYGIGKSDALAAIIKQNYPFSQASSQQMLLGKTEVREAGSNQLDELYNLIGSVHATIDCSAELSVNNAMSSLCKQYGVPYLLLNATPGSWGGMVIQFDPKSNHACWYCVRSFLYDPPNVCLPPADPNGELQPPGCAAQTFTGTSFDLTEISLEAVRVLVGILAENLEYPSTSWQLGVCTHRVGDQRVAPQWSMQNVPRRPDCTCGV